jgi:hypothetical protein
MSADLPVSSVATESSEMLQMIRNMASKIDQVFSKQNEQGDHINQLTEAFNASTLEINEKFETQEFRNREIETQSMDTRSRLLARDPTVRFATQDTSGFTTPLKVSPLTQEEKDEVSLTRLLETPGDTQDLLIRVGKRYNVARRDSEIGLSQLAATQRLSTSGRTPATPKLASSASTPTAGPAPSVVTHRTVQQVEFAHKLMNVTVLDVEKWDEAATKWMNKYEEVLHMRDYIDPTLWLTLKVHFKKTYGARVHDLTNAEVLDGLRDYIQKSVSTRQDFMDYMRTHVLPKLLTSSIDNLSEFPVVAHEVNRFLQEAKKHHDYLSIGNEDNTPLMSGDDGLLKGFIMPGLVHGFGKHFLDTVAKKDTATTNNFDAFVVHCETETQKLSEAALAARQVEKLMKAVRRRNGGGQQQQQQVLPRGQPPLPGRTQERLDDMNNMEMTLNNISSNEPSPRACHHAVFEGTACHKADCRFDHSPGVVKKWRQHWYGRLETLLGEYKRSASPPPTSRPGDSAPAQGRPSQPAYGQLHALDPADLPDEGREMYDRIKARNAELDMNRASILDALIATLSNSNLADMAEIHNRNVGGMNHGVKQRVYKD